MTAETPHVLVVDDEADLRELLVITLGRMKLKATAAENLASAKEKLSSGNFDLCLTDMNLGDGTGMELLQFISRHCPDMPAAVITAYGNMETATEAMKFGAYDFISKPVALDRLRQLIEDGLGISGTEEHSDEEDNLIGDAPAMKALKAQVRKLARSQAPIYISGESGSGKERIARLIHSLGPRRERPFVAVNCGAIPSELMESEFFGHRKGAFTGAVEDRKGLFREADGGTLFLDEVADLPLHMQVKLLRAIQEKSVRPVGEAKEFQVNLRILCATHKDLSREMSEGRFRQDLFYRLNVIEAHVPPLRERQEDIPSLVDHILTRLSRAWDITVPTVSTAAMKSLCHYAFPGNVRELENTLERALTLCDGVVIDKEHLRLQETSPVAAPPSGPWNETSQQVERPPQLPLEEFLQEIEKTEILKALDATHWNRTAAAKKLGMTFRSLRYRLKKLELDRDDEGNE
ncbi:MAG: sigma-54 dependent transcriptional regulator [Pseudomonadales bacterium]|uniref:Sigma-54-dependent Fis family transcriptional regulator n=1 Tax=Alcanivorax profundi TaxID=2338368 RepID=A0A418XTF1_9GAMM|nr:MULTISPECIES: sigma-54 dependent transcriptional regulator [Alcanivorax]ERP86862.1 chemotaxis protein CheY [Alcanivorax sp. P2S70]MCG8415807.1 sigma-54 dependent transcriptional regulator [Pseudomonadales bacterium]RJG15959.1 sigma-54-dependent Fis family transcriptional regulator [Alcanivorax profundi]